MTELVTWAEQVHSLETSIRLGPGFELPLRSTLLELDSGLALISPVKIDDALAAKIEAIGPVKHIMAPSKLHHLYAPAARRRWPDAKLHVAEGLPEKRKGLAYDHLLGEALPAGLQGILLGGSPALNETVFFHPASKTLVVTDLVFNIKATRGFMTPIFLWLAGAKGKLAQSRALRFATRDREAAYRSVTEILDCDFERLIMAHGEVIASRAKDQLREALHWMLSARMLR